MTLGDEASLAEISHNVYISVYFSKRGKKSSTVSFGTNISLAVTCLVDLDLPPELIYQLSRLQCK